MPVAPSTSRRPARRLIFPLEVLALSVIPTLAAFYFMKLSGRDFSIPFSYDNGDPIWQLALTKGMLDNGWILTNPYLGAPGIAQLYNNSAAQTSALHSVLLWFVGQFTRDAVTAQQYYYVLNFPLITATSYVACRLVGIGRPFAFCVGMLFAFLPYRFTMIPYSFLPNFFMVPLAILLPIWILTGKLRFLAPAPGLSVAASLRSSTSLFHFGVGMLIAILISVSDGYYAFFTLLLMGFATGLRVLCGDIRRPQSLLAPVLLMGLVAGVALLLAQPLRTYRLSHPEEFAPNGIPDSSLVNKPFEAEVYSSSIKLLLAPSPLHRIPTFAARGNKAVESSDQARKYPNGQLAPLGTLGGILFLGLLASVVMTLVRGRLILFAGATEEGGAGGSAAGGISTVSAIGALALFAFTCSIAGGFGSLFAFVYPTIRAYDRFPIFLSFLLYCGAALMLTTATRRMTSRGSAIATAAAVTVLSLYDQVPADILGAHQKESRHYLAERKFVQAVEATLPPATMVYQYPHSQYLTDNRYYGWGSFRHIRLYLHSHHLRWSNGASKNSPVDNWDAHLDDLPVSQIVTEAQAAGFRGFVVDRSAVPEAEYEQLRTVLTARTNREPMGDEDGQLAFWPLPDPGYRLDYEPDFRIVRRVTITDPVALASAPMSRFVNREALIQYLAASPAGATPEVIERAADPALFRDSRLVDLGFGHVAIKPGELHGDVSCAPAIQPLSVSRDALTISVSNRSAFDWQLNSGQAPLRIGMMELLNADGSRLRWDGGFRVPGWTYIPQGTSVQLHFPLSALDLGPEQNGVHQVTAVFALLQEGNAWFAASQGNGECHVAVVR